MKIKFYDFTDYTKWDHQIFLAACDFQKTNDIWPNILLTDTTTLEAIDLFMSKKLVSEGKVSEITNIAVFASDKGDIQICIENEIPDHSFKLIYDEEAEFVDEEDAAASEHFQNPGN